jgi:hypothetical protein
MSQLEVNKVLPQSGTTLTLGESGDTITIPSGATLSSTDPLVFSAGTVSLPSITTTGDTNTGIFFPSADTIAFTEGGTEAMRIDSDGDVGINTTSPETKLHVKGTSATVSPIKVQGSASNGTNLFSDRATSTESFLNIGLQWSNAGMFLGSFVKPSTSSLSDATGYLSSYGAGSVKRSAILLDGGDGIIKFLNTNTSATVAVDTAVAMTERMRITSDGLLQFNSGYGSVATAFGCRAWVNFNGTGTPAIRASGNVTSITDNGVGQYSVNFTNNMPDANYAAMGAFNWSNNGNQIILNSYATNSVNVLTLEENSFVDRGIISAAVFR